APCGASGTGSPDASMPSRFLPTASCSPPAAPTAPSSGTWPSCTRDSHTLVGLQALLRDVNLLVRRLLANGAAQHRVEAQLGAARIAPGFGAQMLLTLRRELFDLLLQCVALGEHLLHILGARCRRQLLQGGGHFLVLQLGDVEALVLLQAVDQVPAGLVVE